MNNNIFSIIVVFLTLSILSCQSSPEVLPTTSTIITKNNLSLKTFDIVNTANNKILSRDTFNYNASTQTVDKELELILPMHNYTTNIKDCIKWEKNTNEMIHSKGISAVKHQFSNISFPKLLTYFLKNLR